MVSAWAACCSPTNINHGLTWRFRRVDPRQATISWPGTLYGIYDDPVKIRLIRNPTIHSSSFFLFNDLGQPEPDRDYTRYHFWIQALVENQITVVSIQTRRN
jgi:hypothetical protein